MENRTVPAKFSLLLTIHPLFSILYHHSSPPPCYNPAVNTFTIIPYEDDHQPGFKPGPEIAYPLKSGREFRGHPLSIV